jgi:hypothetical protein
MTGEENSTLRARDEDEDEGLGAGFFFKVAGVCVLAGIVALILFLIFSRAVYAWGFFGAFLAGAGLLLLFGWYFDRRNPRA